MLNRFGICPENCGELILPTLDVDQNCTDYETYASQVCGIYFVQGLPPTDWEDAAEWRARVDNGVVDPQGAKYLVGIGGLPVPEKVVRELPKFQDKTVKRRYTLTMRVLNLSDIQYNFLVSLQCGRTDYRFWYETVGGHLFGGPTGIAPAATDADLPHGEGRQDTDEGIVTLQFESRTEPPRTGWTPLDTSDQEPTPPRVEAYGPLFNGSEVYGPSANEYYTYQ